MDCKELIENQDFSSSSKIADWIWNATCAITDLLARAEAAEAKSTAVMMVNKSLSDALKAAAARAEKAENIASDLCDDFTDFVTGGVHNAAPYCANCRPECINARGWCNGDNKVCHGFMPKAAVQKEK